MNASTRTYLASLAFGAVGLTNTVFGAALTSVAAEYRVSLATAGSLVALQYAGFITASLAIGPLMARAGQRAVILSGYGLMALGLALFSLVGAWPLAQASALVMGLGFGVCGTTVNTYAADLNPGRRGWALGLVNFAFGCGALLSPFVAALLLVGGRSWRWLFAFDAALAVGALALFALMLRRPAPGLPARASRAGAAVWRAPGVPLAALVMALYMGIQMGLTTWVTPHIGRALGAAPALATLGGTTLWVGLTAGRLASSFLGERFGYARTLTASAALGLLLLGGLLLLPSPEPAVGAALLVGLAFGPCFPMALAAGGLLLPGRPGALTGVVLAAGGVGAALIPWLAGQVAAMSAQSAALGVVLLFALALLLICPPLGRAAVAARSAADPERDAALP